MHRTAILGLAAAVALAWAGAAAAEDYRETAGTNDSATWIDKDSVKTTATGTKTANGVLVYSDKSEEVRYVRFQGEFNCDNGQSRYLDIAFYRVDRSSTGAMHESTPWTTPPRGSVNDEMTIQVCTGQFKAAQSSGTLDKVLAGAL